MSLPAPGGPRAPLPADAEALMRRVARLIREGGDAEALALEVFAFQRARVPAYGRFARDADPRCFAEIPAVPVGVFKDVDFVLEGVRPGACFHTSGTTSGRPGRHWLPDTEVYELASERWFRTLLPACPTADTVSLVSDPGQQPQSSLGHMVRCFAPHARWFFSMEGGVDLDGAWAALATADGPVFLPATAFALAELLATPRSAVLPPGSVVMVTGGFKGRRVALSADDLLGRTREALGPHAALVGEYGMTELSSQLWDVGDGFQPPPWLHVYAVDPLSGAPVEGEGLLRFVDLANWGSCLAVETEDLGVVDEGRVHLRGRLPQAPPRGCSLVVEEAADAR